MLKFLYNGDSDTVARKDFIMQKNLFKKMFDRFVYKNTEKPEHYVHVDEPKSLQDYRQMQYNGWCKRNGVYNGSYLPAEHRTLLKKGWIDTTHPNGKKNKPDITYYRRKSSGQRVVHHDETESTDKHYHWYNNLSNSNDDYYFDRCGKTCKKGKPATHLAPLDRIFNFRRKK